MLKQEIKFKNILKFRFQKFKILFKKVKINNPIL